MKTAVAALWLTAAGPAGAEAEPTPAEAEQTAAALVVDSRGMERDEILAALRLRLPGREVHALNAEPEHTDVVYATLRVEPGVVLVSVIEVDGHAYDRQFEAEDPDRIRVAASALANLIFSVEAGEAKPDRTNVEPPQPEPPPVVENPPDTRPPSPPEPPPAVAKPPPLAPRPTTEIGISLGGGLVLGVAPQNSADTFGGAGGSVALMLRTPRGVAGLASFRGLARNKGGVGLGRFRVALGAGYIARPAMFEIAVIGALSVEPWILRRGGSNAPLQRDASSQRRSPLLGGLVSVTPAYLARVGRKRDFGIRVGPFVELAGSFAVADGARTIDVELATPTGDPTSAFRLGGFEISAGLDLGFWFAVAPR